MCVCAVRYCCYIAMCEVNAEEKKINEKEFYRQFYPKNFKWYDTETIPSRRIRPTETYNVLHGKMEFRDVGREAAGGDGREQWEQRLANSFMYSIEHHWTRNLWHWLVVWCRRRIRVPMAHPKRVVLWQFCSFPMLLHFLHFIFILCFFSCFDCRHLYFTPTMCAHIQS